MTSRARLNCLWVPLSVLVLVPIASPSSAEQTLSIADQSHEHVKKGEALLEDSDWDGALLEYREAVRLMPDNADAHVGIGRALDNKGDRDGSMREFKEALRLMPESAEAHNGVAWILGENGDITGEMKECREAIRLKPDFARAHSHLGWVLMEEGDSEGALREYRQAVRLKPGAPETHEGLAWALSQNGDWKGALEEYQKAIRAKPKDPEPHLTLGSALFSRRDYDGALAEYREAARLKPDSAKALTDIGLALARKGDAEGALREYREAIRLHPDYANAHSRLAIALSQKGDWTGTILEAREATRLDPNLALGHFTLGRGLEHQGDRKAALDEYRKAVKLDARNDVFVMNYSRLDSDVRFLPASWSPGMVRAFTLAAALVPSFLLLGYFRARDLYPEPGRALWATFGLGILTVFPVIMVDRPLDKIVNLFHGAIPHGAADAFFTAGIPEEFWKFVVVFFFCARLKVFTEPMDGIVYGAVASLGFATFENITYVTDYGLETAFVRALTSVPGHAFMGAVMGYFVGQWRFGPPAHRWAALLKAYAVPVGLHWMYDFPLLARESARGLAGPGRLAALAETEWMPFISFAIFLLEMIWAVLLVNRLRRQQIQITRDAALAAARADGAMDLVALVNAPDPPPSSWPGTLMAVLGALVATFGAFVTFFIAIYFVESRARGNFNVDVFWSSFVGGIPLLIGLVLFVYGAKRINASRRGMPAPPLSAPARA